MISDLMKYDEAKDVMGAVAFWVKCRVYGAIIFNVIAFIVILYFGIKYRKRISKAVSAWFERLFG